MNPLQAAISAVQGTKLPSTGYGNCHPYQVRRTMVPEGPVAQEVLMVTLFMPTVKTCTTGLLMKQLEVGPGPNQSIFKHLLMTVLDRGGGVIWGVRDPREGALE